MKQQRVKFFSQWPPVKNEVAINEWLVANPGVEITHVCTPTDPSPEAGYVGSMDVIIFYRVDVQDSPEITGMEVNH